jgi:hypothetical protein
MMNRWALVKCSGLQNQLSRGHGEKPRLNAFLKSNDGGRKRERGETWNFLARPGMLAI